jgi:hypothetical protein
VWTQLDALRQSLVPLEPGEAERLAEELRGLHERLKRADELADDDFAAAARYAVEERVDELTAAAFVGRDALADDLDRFVGERPSGSLLLAGPSGSGKSAFLARWVRKHHAKNAFVAYHFVSQDKPDHTAGPEQCWKNLVRQVLAYHVLTPRQLGARVSDRDDLFKLLERTAERRRPLVVVVDGLDELEWQKWPQSPFPRQLPDGVYVIASTRLGEEPFLRPEAWHYDRLLELPGGLDAAAIGRWLQQAGDGS